MSAAGDYKQYTDMKLNLVIFCCIVAMSTAIPLTDSSKDGLASKFDSNGPQPVDEVIAITRDGEENASKRVARHYGGGVSIGIGVPIVASMLLFTEILNNKLWHVVAI